MVTVCHQSVFKARRGRVSAVSVTVVGKNIQQIKLVAVTNCLLRRPLNCPRWIVHWPGLQYSTSAS